MRVFGVAGWKNSGKTTLMERLVAEFAGRGHSVSTVKHAHHAFDVDQDGTDSHRHRVAGAREVLLSSSRRFALMHELRGDDEPSLDKLLSRLAPVDLVLVEGFKDGSHPKIEAQRRESAGEAAGKPLLAQTHPGIVAIASDDPAAIGDRLRANAIDLPVFNLDDTAGIADFIARESGLVQ